MKIFVISSAVLALSAVSGVALAQDDYYGWQHQADHQEHRQEHRYQRAEHAYAHEVGAFRSEEEHDQYHDAVRYQHQQFHEDHPGTWHDHYRRPSYGYSRSYTNDRGYGQPYGYSYAQPYSGSYSYSYSRY